MAALGGDGSIAFVRTATDSYEAVRSFDGARIGLEGRRIPNGRIRILVIDPALLMRNLIANLLSANAPEFAIRTAPDLESDDAPSPPDVVVLSGQCGIAEVACIGRDSTAFAKHYPRARIVRVCGSTAECIVPISGQEFILPAGAGVKDLIAIIRRIAGNNNAPVLDNTPVLDAS